MRTLPLLFVVLPLLAATPALAQPALPAPSAVEGSGVEGSSSSVSSAERTGSGTDVWAPRMERAQGFANAWETFAPVFANWQATWEKTRGKLTSHLDRCGRDVRSSNRSTLLPVILLCYRGQLLLEQDTLKREREVVSVWPGVEADVKVAMVQQIDALLGAIQPVLDALDAKVFTTMATFKDVRRNLLTQYRQPYWLAAAHLRADAARTWLTYLLLSLQPLLTDDALQPEAVLACFEGVDPLLASAAAAPTIEESRAGFSEAKERLETCSSLLQEAERAQNQSSSPSP